MLYRKIKLSTFGLYLKAVSKLWLVPLLTVNVLVPVISAVLYKNGGAGAESDIVTVMYFLLPISTVWTSIFVSEFFFSERTGGVLFFYSRKKRFAVSQLFFLLPLANVAAVTLLLAVGLNAGLHRYGDLSVMALDVGQGESVALYTREKAVLVDCGSSNGYISAGARAADQLESMGIHRLSAVAVTHYHADHTNGLEELLARMPVELSLIHI